MIIVNHRLDSISRKIGTEMDVIQRYTRALASSNLRDDAYHHSTEVLVAAALSDELGTSLFRVKFGNDLSGYAALQKKWLQVVKSKAENRRWPDAVDAKSVALAALEYWLNDVCPECTGRAFETIRNVPSVLSDSECRSCLGTGRRELHASAHEQRFIEDMVDSLDARTKQAAGLMMKRLSSAMDL